MTIKQLIDMPQLSINKIENSSTTIKIFASIRSNRSQCPVCGRYSTTVHDFYFRSVSDLSAFQNRTLVMLKTRKFRCKNPRCNQKVFSEQTPYIHRYSRRTKRASKILDSLSIEMTGRLGSILSEQLLIKVSISTITRIAYKQELPKIKQPRILGVDDWAYRKGVSYGTILIDMETSTPIDILPSREGKELKNWLKKYPDVKIVTRDRASAYSSAINEVCPDAIQIADRFHLLMNLSDALDKYFKSISHTIRTLIRDKTNEIIQARGDENGVNATESLSGNTVIVPKQFESVKVDKRLDTFNIVKELQKKGIAIKKISRDLKINRSTVRSYFLQETLSPRIHHKTTNIELFTSHILVLLNNKGYQVKNIIDEISQLGYNGSQTQAYTNIKRIKEDYGILTPDFAEIQQATIPYVKPINSRKLVKYIDSRIADILDPDERKSMHILLDNIAELKIVRKLVQIFKTMLRRGHGNIRKWIDFIIRSKYRLPGLKTFANGLLRDIQAVENGISMQWSNGAVEGHVNRIKSKKRQMYGRACFDLLRRKVILSQTG